MRETGKQKRKVRKNIKKKKKMMKGINQGAEQFQPAEVCKNARTILE